MQGAGTAPRTGCTQTFAFKLIIYSSEVEKGHRVAGLAQERSTGEESHNDPLVSLTCASNST